ncbi:hypothetical protein [Actinopolyspora mzabensis]|nr:hypothetical protein [Actinopolyspora mzabensis]
MPARVVSRNGGSAIQYTKITGNARQRRDRRGATRPVAPALR